MCESFGMILGTTTTHNGIDVGDNIFLSTNSDLGMMKADGWILDGDDTITNAKVCYFPHFYHFVFGFYFYRLLFCISNV